MNPFQALISTYVAGAGAAQSGAVTLTFILTQEFEAQVPIIITNPATANISASPEVTVYRSTNLGLSWETVGSLVSIFPRLPAAGAVQSRAIRLETGWYLVSVQVGGGVASTWTAQLGTAWAITAYA